MPRPTPSRHPSISRQRTQKDEFFHQTPAQIFAHLLKKGPSPHQLAEWMADSDDLGEAGRGNGDELSTSTARPDRSGRVYSHLSAWWQNRFRLLPEKDLSKPHVECPHLGQGTQGMDLHYVAPTGARNAPSPALALDRLACHAAAQRTPTRTEARSGL